jgi:hypothetical protein
MAPGTGQVVDTPSACPTPYVTEAAIAATANCRTAVVRTLRPDMKPIAAPSASAATAPITGYY